MADHDTHAPGLPEVHDEAADTPMWVPITGLALLVAFVLAFALSAAMRDEEAPPADAAQAEAEAEAPADEGAAEQPGHEGHGH